ncbi:IS66 family insertion sequence element accessory protein TnpB [Salisediminibacterium selenitireducens]|uniref:IS66 Orf2 family protein n=1 Tax=Bacillus selenitireducens (strain ATCC 700615 / DSM 15326 / MLS10) TaxID=439292 RepID=D6XYE0_BACIE|nr:IS66 family insertion sequence element accessory protein TnpB [Salisediminibacterium selenitireducens]ADH98367.1 IS66 Orf2 family protein [[Bacillus] selenitireducens MLS10]ADI00209.1 IS66 Orf2 family protein [[Bacillus] selenitireducens MLS10]
MIGQIHPKNVYLARGSTDLRKSIDGLAAIVQEGFELDPFSSSLFVFCNRYRDKIKILYWDHNGFWLYYRRLEKGRFPWPTSGSDEPMIITERQLRWLLDGLPLDQKGAHRKMNPEKVV